MNDLVRAIGMEGVSKSQVSRLLSEIDERVHDFLSRPIEGEWPYFWLDAAYVKAREAVVRAVLGMAVGSSEAEPFRLVDAVRRPSLP